VHGHDRRTGAEVGIPDEGIEFAPRLGESFVDSAEPFTLLGVVGMPILSAQTETPL
jgi:hypothetical protein